MTSTPKKNNQPTKQTKTNYFSFSDNTNNAQRKTVIQIINMKNKVINTIKIICVG